MKKFTCLFAVLFLLAAFTSAYSEDVSLQNEKKIAVLPFSNLMKDASLDWLSGGISSTITTKLGNVKGIVLVERSQIEAAVKELSFQSSGFVDEKMAKEMGKMLGVDVITVGEFQKAGDTLRITARFVDVQSGKIISTSDATGNFDGIFKLQDDIAFSLLKSLGIEATANVTSQIKTNSTESLTALQWFEKGYKTQGTSDCDKAIEYYTKAIEVDNAYFLPYLQRGTCYYNNKKDYDTALKDFSKAMELHPQKDTERVRALANRGSAFAAKDKCDAAIKDFNEAIEINPGYAFAYLKRGDCYQNYKKDYESAIKDYSKALELFPQTDTQKAIAFYNRGLAFQTKEEWESAIEDYNKAIEINPKYFSAYFNRGSCYYFGKGKRKDFKDQCIADWKKAADLGSSQARKALKDHFGINY